MKKESVEGIAIFILIIVGLKTLYEGLLNPYLPRFIHANEWMSWISFIDLLDYTILLLLIIVILQLNTILKGVPKP